MKHITFLLQSFSSHLCPTLSLPLCFMCVIASFPLHGNKGKQAKHNTTHFLGLIETIQTTCTPRKKCVERASSTWAGPVGQASRPYSNRSGWLGPLRLISLSSGLGFGLDVRSTEEARYRIRMTERLWKPSGTSHVPNRPNLLNRFNVFE